MKNWTVVFIGAALALSLVVGVACGDDDDDGEMEEPTATTAMETEEMDTMADEAEIEATVQAALDGWNGSDVEGLLAAFVDEAAASDFVDPAPDMDLQTFLEQFAGLGMLTLGPATVEVDGDTATLEALGYSYDGIIQPQRFDLVNQDGAWLISNQEDLMIEPPADATVIDVDMTEYAFTLSQTTLPVGTVALNVTNSGGELHEIAIAGVGIVWPQEPGAQATVILEIAAEPGEYQLSCPVTTVEGERHSDLGMVADLTIE